MYKMILRSQLLFGLGVLLICFIPAKQKITIFSIGDSTMASYSKEYLSLYGENYPIRGWMQMIDGFFNKDVEIINAAVSGHSSKSFKTNGEWKKIMENIQPGDYVFIQFGHNDAKTDTVKHTDPQTTFRQNIIDYVTDTKSKGGIPILFTSVPRRVFTDDGVLKDTHGQYVIVVRELAQELKIPLIDMNTSVTNLLNTLGPEESKKLYLYVQPGIYKKLPDGKKDDTHFCEYGATKLAELAVAELKKLNLPIAKKIK
jgi:lysophospholipase L1-like esterase